MISWWKYHKSSLLLIVFSIVLYALFAYDLDRTESIKLIGLYSGLFIFAFLIVQFSNSNFRILVAASVIFRLVFILAIPNLSQDFYRFIWDGRMLLQGFNPYLYLPITFFEQGSFPIEQGLELYQGMGELSANNYTNYPPINQLCFAIAGLFSGQNILGSVVIMRLIIIGSDIGILYFGKKLLEGFNLSKTRIFWYALNPFIIIELTGNLHFESLMLFFLIWSLYLLHKGKWQWAAVLIGCSITVKLVPLMLLPLFIKFFKTRDSKNESVIDYRTLVTFYFIVGLTILILYAPFYSTQFVTNYSESVGLWFGDFEFNASIYYLARALGFWISGYNEIVLISKILSILTVLLIFGLALFRKNDSVPQLMTSMLLAVSIYFFLSTTVHPWYISTLILLCVFTRYRFPLVWSVVIVLSYLAYTNTNFYENIWVVALQYTVVFSALIRDVLKIKKKRLIL